MGWLVCVRVWDSEDKGDEEKQTERMRGTYPPTQLLTLTFPLCVCVFALLFPTLQLVPLTVGYHQCASITDVTYQTVQSVKPTSSPKRKLEATKPLLKKDFHHFVWSLEISVFSDMSSAPWPTHMCLATMNSSLRCCYSNQFSYIPHDDLKKSHL